MNELPEPTLSLPLAPQRRPGAAPGGPAWDPDFNSADLPMMMWMADLRPRYRKHFLEA